MPLLACLVYVYVGGGGDGGYMKTRLTIRSIAASDRRLPRRAEESEDPSIAQLYKAVAKFNAELESIEKRRLLANSCTDSILHDLSRAISEMSSACEEFEKSSQADRQLINELQKLVRQETDRFFLQSRFMRHARTWPRGYPGDFEILEDIYDNVSKSDGMGDCLDRYFLSTILARAVQGRKETMRGILKSELERRKGLKILNVACGSCREIMELAPEVSSSGARMICIDADPAAVEYSRERLAGAGLAPEVVNVRRYNALKMVSHDRNLSEFGMQDIIYSIGLFDYLRDDLLVAIISALYRLVNPGGKFIAAFKDSRRYKTQEYHWLVDWSSFIQRTEDEQRSLIERAGIPMAMVSNLREASGVVLFFIAKR